ncbi:MAG: AAA family ATPase [Ginsengibacter sp.]
MITKIEINGFKTFENFSMEFAPIVIIAGTNGSGKSNLFDVLMLISSIAEKDLKEAFSEQRGDARELFTQYTDNQSSDLIKIAVELFIDKKVKDDWGTIKELSHTRLRYDIHIERKADLKSGIEKLFVRYEVLRPIEKQKDKWFKRFIKDDYWKPSNRSHNYKPYINTENKNGVLTISLRQDGPRGGKPTPAKEIERSILSGVNSADFPHVFAVRKEFLNWRLLHLNPIEMREPSPILGPDKVNEDGKYLPSMLRRLEIEEPGILKNISRSIQNILPIIKSIRIDEDKARQQFVLYAKSTDNREFSSRVLSEGTLRILLLSALKYDESHSGLLCFEEPENGIHPFRMKNMLRLLKDLTTDFTREDDSELPLRQVLINTHSPLLVKEYFDNESQYKGLFYYAHLVTYANPARNSAYKITKLNPVQIGTTKDMFPDELSSDRIFTHAEVIDYLSTDDSEKSIIELLKV